MRERVPSEAENLVLLPFLREWEEANAAAREAMGRLGRVAGAFAETGEHYDPDRRIYLSREPEAEPESTEAVGGAVPVDVGGEHGG
jgi:hypothetical protein